MKKSFFLFIVSLISFIVFSYGQRFQVTTGTTAAEEKWAVVEDPAINGYVAIGNAFNSAFSGRLWISSYTATGVISTSAIATNGRRMIARDICLAPPLAGQPTYYVTGWTELPGSPTTNQMFVGRIKSLFHYLQYRRHSDSEQHDPGKNQEQRERNNAKGFIVG